MIYLNWFLNIKSVECQLCASFPTLNSVKWTEIVGKKLPMVGIATGKLTNAANY